MSVIPAGPNQTYIGRVKRAVRMDIATEPFLYLL
jgi:hypothetical protein